MSKERKRKYINRGNIQIDIIQVSLAKLSPGSSHTIKTQCYKQSELNIIVNSSKSLKNSYPHTKESKAKILLLKLKFGISLPGKRNKCANKT